MCVYVATHRNRHPSLHSTHTHTQICVMAQPGNIDSALQLVAQGLEDMLVAHKATQDELLLQTQQIIRLKRQKLYLKTKLENARRMELKLKNKMATLIRNKKRQIAKLRVEASGQEMLNAREHGAQMDGNEAARKRVRLAIAAGADASAQSENGQIMMNLPLLSQFFGEPL